MRPHPTLSGDTDARTHAIPTAFDKGTPRSPLPTAATAEADDDDDDDDDSASTVFPADAKTAAVEEEDAKVTDE